MTIILLAAFLVLAGGLLAGLGAAAWQGWCDASARVTTCLNTIEPPDLSTEFDDNDEIDFALWRQELTS
jgi:hypothetical protein